MTTSRSKKAKPTSLTPGASRHAKRHLVSVARAAEVADAHGNKLAQLLDIQVNGSSSGGRCSWTLATLDDTDREKRAAVAWVIANNIIRARCGRAKAYGLWRAAALAETPLTGRDRAIAMPFLDVYGDPASPPSTTDHLEGHVNEWLWYLLTGELATRNVAVIEPPSFQVTAPGGDGFVIYRRPDTVLMFRLWELKKHVGSRVAATINLAYTQLAARATKYLAQLTPTMAVQDQDIRDLYGQLVELWVDADERAGAGVGVSAVEATPRPPFRKMGSKFPEFTSAGQLEGLFCAIADYRGLASEVRRMVWSAL